MSMDAALAGVNNDFIVIIVQLYRNKSMRSHGLNTFADVRNCGSEAPSFRWGSARFIALKKTLMHFAKRWYRRYQLRRSLQEMDVQLIEKDIGVGRGSLFEEAYKPFWRE